MISLKKRKSGFTIVELLIVIVVIGILALLVITTYSGIQAKARNAKRQNDLLALQTQLEAFFQQNGYYPSRADMNQTTDKTWLADNMKSLDVTALADPSSTITPPGNQQLSDTPTHGVYAYLPKDSTNSAANCETTDTTCSQYTLTATYEGTVGGAPTDVKVNLD